VKNKGIDENIESYYAQQKLAPEILARMKLAHDAGSQSGSKTSVYNKVSHTAKYLAIAASIMLMIGVGFQWMQDPSPNQLMQSVVKEVMLNHQKNLAIEFAKNDYKQLAFMMKKLDFTIQEPKQMTNSGYTLLGSRYCSIQGHIAAQIKLRDSQNRVATLYITQLNDTLALLQSKQQVSGEVLVNTWYEGDLFYSLASGL